MKKEKYTIFEFDETPLTKIEPSHSHKKTEGYEYCVITFFREVLDELPPIKWLFRNFCAECQRLRWVKQAGSK